MSVAIPSESNKYQSSKPFIKILMDFAFEHGAKWQVEHAQTYLDADFMFGQRKLAIYPGTLKVQHAILTPGASQIELVFEVDRNMLGGEAGSFQAQLVIADYDDFAHGDEFNLNAGIRIPAWPDFCAC